MGGEEFAGGPAADVPVGISDHHRAAPERKPEIAAVFAVGFPIGAGVVSQLEGVGTGQTLSQLIDASRDAVNISQVGEIEFFHICSANKTDSLLSSRILPNSLIIYIEPAANITHTSRTHHAASRSITLTSPGRYTQVALKSRPARLIAPSPHNHHNRRARSRCGRDPFNYTVQKQVSRELVR